MRPSGPIARQGDDADSSPGVKQNSGVQDRAKTPLQAIINPTATRIGMLHKRAITRRVEIIIHHLTIPLSLHYQTSNSQEDLLGAIPTEKR